MERKHQRIEEDLRGLIEGEVRCDPVYRELFATDASLFDMAPLGVVSPRSVDDVVATAKYANANQIPIHARGAGTGLAGGAVGPGLAIDFSRFMRSIGRINGETVRVQPGATIDALNRRLASAGRCFGPDPAKRTVSTIGGAVSVNASGSHWLRSADVRRHVREIEVVLANGERLTLGEHPLEPRTDGGAPRRLSELVQGIATLVHRNADTIASTSSDALVNSAGYCLEGLVHGGSVNLARLLVGSEGTLALVTRITLTTEPLPPGACCVLLFFDRMEDAASAVGPIMEMRPSACDLMDRRHLNLARAADVNFELMAPGEAEAVLLVEFERSDPSERAAICREVLQTVGAASTGSFEAIEPDDVALAWRLARSFTPSLSRVKGRERIAPFIEDTAVPPESLGEYLATAQRILRKHDVTASMFCHAGHGHVHLRPLIDTRSSFDRGRLVDIANELYEVVWNLRGVISGGHGDGLSRTPFLKRQYGERCDLFQSVKRLFDPDNVLNPGKIVPTEDVAPVNLLNGQAYPSQTLSDETAIVRRPYIGAKKSNSASNASSEPIATASHNVDGPITFPLQLAWRADDFVDAIDNCNRCGVCRSESIETRMCPIFRSAPTEAASPRAKANMLSGVLSGRLSSDAMTSDVFKETADLCVHCHMCRLECPAEVDIPRLMLEAKGAYVRANGVSFSRSFIAAIDRLSAVASRFPTIANWAIANRVVRWVAEKTLGISQSRPLPQLSKRPFIQDASRMGIVRERTATDPTGYSGDSLDRVVYFADTYANYFDASLARSFVRVLEHNGVSVVVPPDLRPAGMPYIAQGAIETARNIARHNVTHLADAARQGYAIVATEPSAALALAKEYPYLIDDDEDVRLVADVTMDACHYLWKLHLRGRLRLDFQRLDRTIGYHCPCHVKALQIGAPTENMLRLIPGLRVIPWEMGCSGMAGLYGLMKSNFRDSMRAGRPLIAAVRASDVSMGVTECSTCKMQIEYAAKTPTVHPIKVLAWAYGLIEEKDLFDGANSSNAGERRMVAP